MSRTFFVAVAALGLMSLVARAQYPTSPSQNRESGGYGSGIGNLFTRQSASEPTLAPPRSTQQRTNTKAASNTRPQRTSPQPQQASGGLFNQIFDPFSNVSEEDLTRTSAEPRVASVQKRPATQLQRPVAPKANPSAPADLVEEEATSTAQPAVAAEKPAPVQVTERTTPAAGNIGNRITLSRRTPQLAVEATGPRRVSVGQPGAYTIVVRNTGDEIAEGVMVFVSIPEWVELADAQCTTGTAAPQTDGGSHGATWTLERVAPQSKQELTLKLVTRRNQPFELGMRWVCSPASSQTLVEVDEPKLQLNISGPTDVAFGQSQSYTLTLSNPGNGQAENVTITLQPLDPKDGQPVTQNLGSMGAGSSKSVDIELVARQNGQLLIAAEATADGNLKSAVQHAVRVRRAELKVVAQGPKTALAGVPVTYEVVVQNPGDAIAKNVRVTAQLPPNTEIATVSQQGTNKTGEVVWNIDQLAAGGEQTLQVRCVLRAAGAQRVAATAAGDDELRGTAETATTVSAFADLALEVNDTPGPIALGQTVTYEVRIRNRGAGSADGVELMAFFSEGIEPVSVEGAAHELGTGMVLIKPTKSLGPSGELVCRIKAKASVSGHHKIRVEASCESLGTKITQEDTTLFYGDDPAAIAGDVDSSTNTSTARRPSLGTPR